MTRWFIDEEDNWADFEPEVGALASRRQAERAGYKIQEEKIGDVQDPDYTMVRVEDADTGEVVAAATYLGSGEGMETVEYRGEELEVDSDSFNYSNSVRLLNDKNAIADGGQSEEDLDSLF
jgi:hypothetical protein